MAQRLEGKVAIVTGSTWGIGRATAGLFAREGAKVVVSGRTAEQGPVVVEEIRAAGGEAVFYRADVAHSDQIRGLIEFAVQTYGRLDVLMNNAFSGRNASVVEVEEADWDYQLAVALKAVYLGAKYAIPEMIKGGGGSIINISSVHGLLAGPRNAPYEAAKAGMINLTRQIAVDFGRQGIRANAICPGWIVTERGEKWLAEHPEAVRRNTLVYPIGRPGRAIDIARAALFLASEESSFVTGHALVVDGGLTAQLQDALIAPIEAYVREAGAE